MWVNRRTRLIINLHSLAGWLTSGFIWREQKNRQRELLRPFLFIVLNLYSEMHK